ncbi:MAG: hypothetical protein AB7E55_03295 [Pigmentiphaga sp.]
MSEQTASRTAIAAAARLSWDANAPCPYRPGTPDHDAWMGEYAKLVEKDMVRLAQESRTAVLRVMGRGATQ